MWGIVQAGELPRQHRPFNYLRDNLEKYPRSYTDQLLSHQHQCHITKAESVSDLSDFYSVKCYYELKFCDYYQTIYSTLLLNTLQTAICVMEAIFKTEHTTTVMFI